MEIKNIVSASGNFSKITLPSWELVGEYNILDIDKRHNVISRKKNNITKRIKFFGDISSLNEDRVIFDIYIHKRNGDGFDSTPLFYFRGLTNKNLNNYEYEFELETSKLIPDGEYIVKVIYTIKNFPDQTIDTQSYFIIEQNNKKVFGYGNNEDYYFSLYYDVDKPTLHSGINNNDNINTLKSYSFITEKSTTSFMLPTNYSGSVIVSVGGLTLSEDLDYTFDSGVILFKDVVPGNTVINITYSGGDSENGLYKDTFIIRSSLIKNYSESFENDFFVDELDRFGLFLSKFVSEDSSPILVINGVTLSEGFDFDVNDTDRRKIILYGELKENDIIDVYYVAEYTMINTTSNYISGFVSIPQPISNEKGRFLIKISKDYTFNEEIGTIVIDYKSGESEFDFKLNINESGIYYIKVINQKDIKILENETFMFSVGNTIKINVDI